LGNAGYKKIRQEERKKEDQGATTRKVPYRSNSGSIRSDPIIAGKEAEGASEKKAQRKRGCRDRPC